MRWWKLAASLATCVVASLGCADNIVQENGPPAVSLTANPNRIATGASATLTWNSTNTTSCKASGGWDGFKATSGSEATGPLTVSAAFTLTCMGLGGSANHTASVAVGSNPAPTVALTANPTSIATGAFSILNWSATDATSCTASGGWSGAQATSGNELTGALTATTSFTMTCTGPGGEASQTAMVTVQGAPAGLFPLRVEAGKRHLVDAAGRPFLLHGESAWRLITTLTKPEADQYLEDRHERGVNAIMVKLIDHEVSPAGPNALGDVPFTVTGDFATPNEAYFAHADYVIRKAAELGILVLLAPAYMGFEGQSQGWYVPMTLNGATKLRAYGRYIATRFQAHNNILWVNGGDFDPPERDLLRAVASGITDVDAKWLHTFHGGRGTSALGFLGTGEAWLSVNNVYTSSDDVVAKAFTEYNRSTMPFFLIEAFYENERGSTAATVRQQAYQALLSGAAGQLMGNNPMWLFGDGWQGALDSPGARSLSRLRALIAPLPWHTLVPDQSNVVLTAGIESGSRRAVAAQTANRSLVLVYTPSARALTVNLGQLAGPNVRARWHDPVSGAFSAVAGSPFVASGMHVFTPAMTNAGGDSDWILVLESSP